MSIISWKSYFKKKAENIAIKEDIASIQKQIEEVSKDYKLEIELLRSINQQAIDKNNLYLTKSTDILLEFYDTILVLYYDKITASFYDMAGENLPQIILNHQNEVMNLFTKVKLDYHRLLVFMKDDEKLMTSAHVLLITFNELQKVYKKHVGPRKIAVIKENEALAKGTFEYEKAVEHSNTINDEYQKALAPFKQQLNNDFGVFIGNMLDKLKTVKLS